MVEIAGDDVASPRPRLTLEQVLGTIAALPGTTTGDFERQIEEAMEEAAEQRLQRLGLAQTLPNPAS